MEKQLVDNELIQDVDPMSPWTSNINNLYSQVCRKSTCVQSE